MVDGVGAGSAAWSSAAPGRARSRSAASCAGSAAGACTRSSTTPAWAAEVRKRIAAEELDRVRRVAGGAALRPPAGAAGPWLVRARLARRSAAANRRAAGRRPADVCDRRRAGALPGAGRARRPPRPRRRGDPRRRRARGRALGARALAGRHRIKFELRVEDGVAIGVCCAQTAGEPDELDERERDNTMRGTRLWLLIGLVALLDGGLFVAAGCGDDDDDDDGDDGTERRAISRRSRRHAVASAPTRRTRRSRSTPDAGLQRLRPRPDQRDRREARPRARVHGHRLRHDLP